MAPCAEKPVKTLAVELSLYLLGVGIRYGRDGVGIDQPAFEHISVSAHEQLVVGHIVIGKTRDTHKTQGIIVALEFQVVYRGNGLYAAEKVPALEAVVEVYGYQTSLPVVTVYKVGTEIHNRKRRKHSTVKEHEAFYVPVMLDIRSVSGEVVLIVYEVELNSVVFRFKHADISALSCKIHIEMRFILHHILPFLSHAGILGKDNSYIIFRLIKIFWQRADNIGKASGLYKRDCLRRRKQYFFHVKILHIGQSFAGIYGRAKIAKVYIIIIA